MDMLEKYENQEIWYCGDMGTRINFNPSTISLCHEAQVGDRVLMKVEEFTPERYFLAIQQIIDTANNDSTFPCRACSKCKKRLFSLQKIRFVTICTSSFCNSKCIYCVDHFGAENSGYDPVPYLEMFHQQQLFSPDCYFDWGGGEPTLNPYYENTVNWLHQRGYYQRFNTNAILFSEMTLQALKDGKGNVRVSVDSGTKDTFRIVKGTGHYDGVWSNIKKYCSASKDVYIKYNIFNYNSERTDIDCFIDQCNNNGVKNIIIDGEISAYQPTKNAGPFYFCEKELDAAKYLEKTAKVSGLNVIISEFAFSVRAECDSAGKFKLPDQYYNNIDSNIISNGVKVTTFATVDQLIDKILMNPDVPVVIWECGVCHVGKKICDIIHRKGLSIRYIINSYNRIDDIAFDISNSIFHKAKNMFSRNKSKLNKSYTKQTSIHDHTVNDAKVTTLNKLKKEHDTVHLILAGSHWRDMLQEINNEEYMINGFIYFMHDVHFHQYEKELNLDSENVS